MPRTKRTNLKRLPPIDLDLDNPAEFAVWKFSQLMTLDGKSKEWILGLLISDVAKRPPVAEEDFIVSAHGFVYLMKASNGLYRIGKSRNPKMRLAAHKGRHPDVAIEIDHLIECDDYNKAELLLHSEFEARRVGRKEWFRLTDQDVIYIKSIKHLTGVEHVSLKA